MTGKDPHDWLKPERALLFRITHRYNLPWILDNGLLCRSATRLDPDFVSIGDEELIGKRSSKPIPIAPFGSLADYVPFYFTPWSPMLYNIVTGYGIRQQAREDMVFAVTSVPRLEEASVPWVMADRHAYLATSRFSADQTDLAGWVPWSALQQRDFRRDPNDPEAFERYQAEGLAHHRVPVDTLLALACYTAEVQDELRAALAPRGVELPTLIRRDWYFP